MQSLKLIALNCAQNPNRGIAFESSLDKYNDLIGQPWLAEMVSRIQHGEESLKDSLPIRCSHYYRFNNNHRAQADMDPEAFLFQTCVDIDDAAIVEQTIAKARELDSQEGSLWKGMLLHMEYSARKKLHIDIRIPVGLTIEEAQQQYCEALGVAFDGSCVSPERFILITDASQTIYCSEHWYEVLPEEELKLRREAYLKRGLTIDGRQLKNQPSSNERKIAPVAQQTELFPINNKVEANPSCLRAFDLCMEEAGLTERALQIEGVRHNSLLSIFSVGACRLMTIEQMTAVVKTRMPEYAEEADCQKLIQDFYQNYTEMNKPMNKRLREIHAEAYGDDPEAETIEAENEEEEAAKHRRKLIAKLLPPGLREPVMAAPKEQQMNVLCAIMPIAAAYADKVEVKYADEKTQYLGLMSLIIGRQAGGKSGCKEAVECWMKILKEESKAFREQEDAVKQQNKCRKANERAQEMPKYPIRKVPITISCSTLLKRFKNAPERCLYSFCEELDTLLKTNSAGNWSAKYDIYRYSFDRAEWGQDFNSDQAESGDVNVIYNWTIFGTYGSFKKCFQRENAENGLGGRVLISELPDTRFTKLPKYRALNAEEQEAIQQAAQKLSEMSGYVDTPRLRKAIAKWVEEKRIDALKNADEVTDNFRRRAAVIAFRCAVVFHLLSGQERESKACIDFMLMMADYCLETQVRLLGDMMASQQANNEPLMKTIGNKSAYDRLPKVFTMDDLRLAKGANFEESSYRSIISKWKKDKIVEELPREELGNGKQLRWRKLVA
jgi:hypothetical protein